MTDDQLRRQFTRLFGWIVATYYVAVDNQMQLSILNQKMETLIATAADLTAAVAGMQDSLGKLQTDVQDVADKIAAIPTGGDPVLVAAVDDAVAKLGAIKAGLDKVDTDMDAMTGKPNP